jgi:SAM-dependent methyltransferase
MGYLKKFETESRFLAQAIYPENFARSLVIEEFIEFFKKTDLLNFSQLNVAVLGGSRNEPEIKVLRHMKIDVNLTLFGIDSDVEFLDLNIENPRFKHSDFDLILCSQVFEHIWNHQVALDNLKKLMNEKTYLWISCPSSNRPHGLSFYFAAGFTESFLVNNINNQELQVLASGTLGTRRIYRAIHTMPLWLSVRGHKFPPIWAFESHPYDKENDFYRLIFSLRYLLRSFELMLFSGKITSDIRCASESWVCARLQSKD